jgi:formate dehydrogenase major subunit
MLYLAILCRGQTCVVVSQRETRGERLATGGPPQCALTFAVVVYRQAGVLMKTTHEPRLTTPLVRKDGEHVPASWDEALDTVARNIQREVSARGPQTFGMFSCSKTTNELNYAAQKFVRAVIGCNNIDSCNRT